MTANWEPDVPFESPSGLFSHRHARGVAMREEDVADCIAAFCRAAVDASKLGFDVVELHGAHGYLIDQFFWSVTNQRDDRYGGRTLRDRARFTAEIVSEIRKALGDKLPIILRVSQWKQQDFDARLATTPSEMADWLVPLMEAGVDVFHCSQRRFWTPEFPEVDGEDGLNFAGWAKKLTGATTISVGSVGLSTDFIDVFKGDHSRPTGIEELVCRMERDEFDLIAVGRALIADPAWATKVQEGRWDELKAFDTEALAELI
jgi:2,4-dienoyl-CoA reductase-like NADH-dependent reductase (Old Yellow Enzyme family)